MAVISLAMFSALRNIASVERGEPTPGRGRLRRFNREHHSTRAALLKHRIVEHTMRQHPGAAGVDWQELDITEFGWGVLAGATLIERAHRRCG